jgi:lysyl-tRNA synthetase, class II
MAKTQDLDQDKLNKLRQIKDLGINPYPYSFNKIHNAEEINHKFSKIKKEQKDKTKVSVAGRIILRRIMGKASFFHIQDETGKVQIYLTKDDLGPESYQLLTKKSDTGDFIGVTGSIFKTRMGEVTIHAKEATFLCKSLLQMPEKFHGIKDIELKYRRRCLDLITNQDSKEVFRKRSLMISAIREYFNERDFMEVETPLLQTQYGGANARPFKTHINAFNMPMYLSISPELFLKRLLVGGFEKVFTICKNFRNEDVDTTHNPEFTMLEIYQSYVDYEQMMVYLEEVYEKACVAMNGSTKVKRIYKGEEVTIDFKAPWPRLTMIEAIKKYANIDVSKMSKKKIMHIIEDKNLEFDDSKGKFSWGLAVLLLFEELVEEHLIQPVHIIDHPKETTPLCKAKRGDDRLVERFESFVVGMELCNAYSELNDPILQKQLLESQAAELRAGADEAHPMDTDFIAAMEYGMPPAGGLGFGIDRMAILLSGVDSIRDVIFFPIMKPTKQKISAKEAEKRYRSKKWVVIANDKLNKGIVANALGQLGIAMGGFTTTEMFNVKALPDKDGHIHFPDSLYPMTNFAGNQRQMAQFADLCYKEGLQFFDFSDIMRKAHTDEQMLKGYKEKATKDIGYIAVAALVPKGKFETFLKNLKLYGA